MANGSRAKQLVTGTVLVFLLVSGLFMGVGTVTANCDFDDPEGMEDCRDSEEEITMNPFQEVLENIYSFAQVAMQYSGFVVVFAGVTLWFGTGPTSERTQLGMWLTFSGLMLIVLFFAMGGIIELLQYIASGGGTETTS